MGEMIFRSSADFRRYLEVEEGVMGGGANRCWILASWSIEVGSHLQIAAKHACVLWGTSKSVANAKLCETKAETYQVKKHSYILDYDWIWNVCLAILLLTMSW